ncbi:hypothetical protein EE612_022752, partial [Oryza sativa]
RKLQLSLSTSLSSSAAEKGHAADRQRRRKRDLVYGALERAPSAAAADIVAVPTAVDRSKPSRHANAFSLKSSSKPLNNPRQRRSKCGDRPPSSSPPVAIAIVVSASSARRPVRAVAVHPQKDAVAGRMREPLLSPRPRKTST